MIIRMPRRLVPILMSSVLCTFFGCAKDQEKDYLELRPTDEPRKSSSIPEENIPLKEDNVIYINEDTQDKEKVIELHKYVIANTNVKIRSDKSTKSDKLGILFEKQILPFINDYGDWVEVSYDGKSAFISKEYIKIIESYDYQNSSIPKLDNLNSISEFLDKKNKIRANTTVNVRSDATIKSEKIHQLKKGDELPLLCIYNDEWYQVDYNGQIAYVYREYADIIQSYSAIDEPKDIVFMISKTPLYDLDTYEIIKNIPKNEIAIVYAQTDDYYIASVNGTIGLIEKIHTQSLGDKYIVIDISSQNLKLYIDDIVIIDTPIVTGKDSTPTYCGIFDVYKMEENVYWKEFDVTVRYGLAFNRGEWIHDAKWRKKFGGSIYQKDGSHGCVNIPPEIMELIYYYSEIGTPVLVKK